MATTDRYVFAEAVECRCGASDCSGVIPHRGRILDTPAPSPEDWQAIEMAVRDFDHYRDGFTLDRIGRLVIAAVRNMREAER